MQSLATSVRLTYSHSDQYRACAGDQGSCPASVSGNVGIVARITTV